MKIFFNGKFIDKEKSKIDIESYCFLRGDGIFETFPVYNGKFFRINDNIERLFNSAKIVNIKIPYIKNSIRHYAESLIVKNKCKDCILRIFVMRGGSIHGNEIRINTIIMTSDLKKMPEGFYRKGIKVSSFQIERPLPEAKTLCFLPSIIAYRYAHKKGSFEALLVDKYGYVAEASSSNVFIVKKGTLITPDKNILEGITRSVILDILKDVYNSDEVFLTNSIESVIPVIRVDSKIIGNGKEGRYTNTIRRKFNKIIENI